MFYRDRNVENLSYRQLLYDINVGRMLQWQDKLRRQVNTLIGRASTSYPNNRIEEEKTLLEEIARDIDTINQLVTDITFM